MGIFSSIKDAIFGKKKAAPAPAAPKQAAPAQPVPHAAPAAQTMAPAPAAPAPMDDVDVIAHLEAMAADHPEPLNWRHSIVDLMKLVGIDSSLAERKQLAQELGYTGALDGSAEMNIWLHKHVMRELAANGGKVPADMLD